MLTLSDLGLDLYSYLDGRALIRDYCAGCKQRDARYSLRFFSKHLGFGAPNYVKLMIDGQRSISESAVDAWSKLMGLKGSEREYFDLLIRWTQAEELERRNHYFQQLSAIRRKKLEIHQLEGAQFDCISSWLHLLIREMSFLAGFEDDPHWIHRHLMYKVPLPEIVKCLKDLEQAGLLQRQDGKLRAVDSSISFPDEVRSLAVQNFHHGLLEQARTALQQPLSQREYGATLVATSPEKFRLVKEKLKKFRAEVLELLDTPAEQGEEVVALAFQLFHVVQKHDTLKKDTEGQE